MASASIRTSRLGTTVVGSPITPSPANNDGRFSHSSKKFRESTHLIPTPGVDKNRPKRYDPVYFWLPVVVGTPLLMLMLGIALEVAVQISYRNGGYAVPDRNVFSLVSTQFLLSFFPTLFVIPVGYIWRVLDWMLRWFQPYVIMSRGNATAEESVLLDYVALGSFRAMFPALKHNHRVIFWSGLLATSTYIFQPLAGSIFQIQTREKSQTSQVTSLRTIGLDPDADELNAFAAAAGFVQAAVFNELPDPPFVKDGWCTAEFEFPTNRGLNGTMWVSTTGIRTNSNCDNPSGPPVLVADTGKTGTITSKSIQGCSRIIAFDPTISDKQYGVDEVDCPDSKNVSIEFGPVVFWFYQNITGNPEAKTVFCNPTKEEYEVSAAADLTTGQILSVNITTNITDGSVLNGDPLLGRAYNAVLFPNNSNPFVQARSISTRVGVPGAIFRSALQAGLQPVFDRPNGFLDLTNKIYTQHLAITAKSVYFINQNNTLDARETSLVLRLWVDPFPAHILAFLLFGTGFLGVFLHLIGRRQRRNLFIAAPPGTIASAVALTSRSGFGELLLPYDNLMTMEKKLDGLRFRLDKRTGAILADEYEPAGDDMATRGPDDAMMSLLGRQREASASSSNLAHQTAAGYPPWKEEELRTPYDKQP
ncbi:hypothetical protein C8J57DRAFT_1124912 [Mycena rebaudengoi]|nr:hypothetical protein C8J57DRAFT_1124912 [Mycena rebaudengoi]